MTKRATIKRSQTKDPNDYHGVTPIECLRCGFWWPCEGDPRASDRDALQHADGTWWYEDCPACTGPIIAPATGEFLLDMNGTALSQRMPVDGACRLRARLSREAFALDLGERAQ